MRIGLLGGSFDPPHNGHLLAASDAFEHLSLDRLIWIPAATQPLKTARPATEAAHRLAMVRLAVQGDPRFDVDSIEVDRGGLSYTVDTLAALAGRWPGAALFWLVGGDALETFDRWREPRRIMELATLVVMQRLGYPTGAASPAGPGAPTVLETRRVDISSTEIRRRVADGKSIKGFVPGGVGDYIAEHGLYR